MRNIKKVITIIMGALLVALMLSGCIGKNDSVDDLSKTTIGSFSSMNFDVSVAQIDIIPGGDEFAMEYHIVNQSVDYGVENGVLAMNVGGNEKVSINSDDKSYIKVYVPEGSEFSSVECKVGVGEVGIQSIKADDMSVKADIGSVTLSDIKVNKMLSVKTEVGNMEVALANSDCSYNIKADIANVTINDEEHTGLNFEEKHKSQNGPQVNLTTNTGDICFDYK